jgi:hypothetical protein
LLNQFPLGKLNHLLLDVVSEFVNLLVVVIGENGLVAVVFGMGDRKFGIVTWFCLVRVITPLLVAKS